MPERIREILIESGLPCESVTTTDEVISRVKYNFQGEDTKGKEICIWGIIHGVKFSPFDKEADLELLPGCELIGKYQIHSFAYRCNSLWCAILWPLMMTKKTIFPEVQGKLRLEKIE